MSYKVFLWDNLSAIEWSQVWRLAGQTGVDVNECEIEQVRDVLLREVPRDGAGTPATCRRGYRVIALDIAHEGVRRTSPCSASRPGSASRARRTPSWAMSRAMTR